MELDGGHLDRPDHGGQFGHAQLVGVPAVAGEVHPHRLQPRRRSGRDPLLVHLFPGHAGREPVQHARPLPQRAHDAISDRQVVPDQVQLGLPAGREVHPARMRDPHLPAPGLHLHLIRGHHRKLTPARRDRTATGHPHRAPREDPARQRPPGRPSDPHGHAPPQHGSAAPGKSDPGSAEQDDQVETGMATDLVLLAPGDEHDICVLGVQGRGEYGHRVR